MGGSKPGFGGKSGGGLFSIDDDEDDDKPSFMSGKPAGGFQPPAPAKSKVANFLDEDDDEEGFIPKIKPPTAPSMPPPLPQVGK